MVCLRRQALCLAAVASAYRLGARRVVRGRARSATADVVDVAPAPLVTELKGPPILAPAEPRERPPPVDDDEEERARAPQLLVPPYPAGSQGKWRNAVWKVPRARRALGERSPRRVRSRGASPGPRRRREARA